MDFAVIGPGNDVLAAVLVPVRHGQGRAVSDVDVDLGAGLTHLERAAGVEGRVVVGADVEKQLDRSVRQADDEVLSFVVIPVDDSR